MPRSDRRQNVNQVTDGYPDPGDNSTLAARPVANERRRSARRIADKLGDISESLRVNAQWIKSFLRP
jgi:hypothetical protein